MNSVTFIMKEGNSFGDQILHLIVNGAREIHSFPEGNWVNIPEYVKMLEGVTAEGLRELAIKDLVNAAEMAGMNI